MENDLTWVPEKDMGQAPVPVVTVTVWVAAVPWDDEIGRQVLGMVRTLKLPEEPKASSSLEAGPRFGPGVETTLVCLITHCGWTCGNFVDDFFLVEIAYFVEKCIEQLNLFTDDYPPLKRPFAPETLGVGRWVSFLGRPPERWDHPPHPVSCQERLPKASEAWNWSIEIVTLVRWMVSWNIYSLLYIFISISYHIYHTLSSLSILSTPKQKCFMTRIPWPSCSVLTLQLDNFWVLLTAIQRLLEDCLDLLNKFLDKIPTRRITASLPQIFKLRQIHVWPWVERISIHWNCAMLVIRLWAGLPLWTIRAMLIG